jgi:hypothetical protein
MKYLLILLVCTSLSSCVASAKYVDKLSDKVSQVGNVVAKNSQAIHLISATPENLSTLVRANTVYNDLVQLAQESSGFDFKPIVNTGMSLTTILGTGGVGTAVLSMVALYFQRRQTYKIGQVARDAATETDPKIAHKLLDALKIKT